MRKNDVVFEFGTKVIVDVEGEKEEGVIIAGPDDDGDYKVVFSGEDEWTYTKSDKITPATKTTAVSSEDAVVSLVGAKVAGLTFQRENDEIVVFDEDGDAIAAITIDQFRQVAKIIDQDRA
jgi:hypothetical protein